MDLDSLVRQALDGDRKAFWDLIEPECTPLLRYIRSRVRKGEDAEDLCQDVIAAALKNLPQLKRTDLFRCWLWGIARNVLRDWIKGLGHVCIALSEEREANLPATRDGNATQRELWEEVDALPEEQREAIRLKYAARCTHDEIAQIMGIGLSTVGKYLFTAREQLRKRLRGYGSWDDLPQRREEP